MISLARVVLPLPLPPVMNTISPGFNVRLIGPSTKPCGRPCAAIGMRDAAKLDLLATADRRQQS